MSENKETDEISIIDIILPIIKYRKMIIIIILVSFVLGLLGLGIFIYMQDQKPSTTTYTYEGRMMCIPAEPVYSLMESKKALLLVSSVLKDPNVVLSAFEELDPDYLQKYGFTGNAQQKINFLRSSFIKHIYKVEARKSITVSVVMDDKDQLEKFLNNMLIYTKINLKEILNETAQTELEVLKQLTETEKQTKDFDHQTLIKDLIRYNSIKRFISGEISGLTVIQEPSFSLKNLDNYNKRYYIKQFILFMVAVIICAIMIAFIRESIVNLKKDKASMEKLHNAVNHKRKE